MMVFGDETYFPGRLEAEDDGLMLWRVCFAGVVLFVAEMMCRKMSMELVRCKRGTQWAPRIIHNICGN